jgi:hypothetical protein
MQTVLSQNAYMLFYTLNKKGSPKSPSANGTKVNGTVNGVKVNGIMNGAKVMSTQIKRPRLDGDEVGAKVDRSALTHKEKRPKVDVNGVKANGIANGIKVIPNLAKRSLLDGDDDEVDAKKRIKVDESASPDNMQEMSKAERTRLKKEKKKARKLEKMNGSNPTPSLNDYELATSVPLSSTTHVPAKAIFGVPVPNLASKNMSPLADLDLVPTPKSVAVKPTSITIPTARHNDWKVTEGAMKSPSADDRKIMLVEHKPKADYKDREVEQNAESAKEDAEQDGWTVKSKPTTQVIVVAHNEASTSKREKLQALIERESEFKSAEVKAAILGEQKHMLGSKVSTWEEPSYAMTKAREEVLRTLKPKHHRPDAYDVEYDRGKVKKVKTKNVMDGPAVGAKVGNKFQKEQDVRNLVKVHPFFDCV